MHVKDTFFHLPATSAKRAAFSPAEMAGWLNNMQKKQETYLAIYSLLITKT
jgi:hypothetical protein